MKKIIIILLFFAISFSVSAQEDFTDTQPMYFFGVRIITTSNGVGQYFIIYAPNGKIENVQTISKANFEKQARGLTYSDANLKKEDMFTANGISNYKIHTFLWKLRYSIYPFATNMQNPNGWTHNAENEYMPRPEQMDILRGYGLKQINGYIWGDNLFRLFKDMETEEWVKAYVQAGAPE